MTVITNQDRKTIVQGMMKKTSFRLRFSKALTTVGRLLYVRQIDRSMLQYGALFDYIGKIPKEFKGHLCNELEGQTDSFNSYAKDRWESFPNLYRLMQRTDGTPALMLEGSRHEFLKVRFPKSIWLPKNPVHLKISELANDAEGLVALQDLERLAGDYQATEVSLAHFLSSVRTVKQLKETMPEAMEYLPEKTQAVALIPEPANALALLSKAGFYEQAVAA
jgi:hypothetical protein